MNKKVLICYISNYSGHFHAAEAIEKGFTEIDPTIEVEKLNIFSYTNPILEKIIKRTYEGIIQKSPGLWQRLYDDPEVLEKLKEYRKRFHNLNLPKIERLIEELSPDIVLCTQAFPGGMISDYKSTSGKSMPLFAVLTDFAPHSYWIFDEVDNYVVPADFCKQRFIEKGVPEKKIKKLGIPVDPVFRLSSSKTESRRDLGLEQDIRTVLIMGGTRGWGNISEVVEQFIAKKDKTFQVLVLAASNKKLFKRIKTLEKTNELHKIKVYPYIDYVDRLMDASDAVITKAGGLSLAEALTKRKPLILVNSIPGQERLNTDYLVREGAALEFSVNSKLPILIDELLNDKEKLLEIEKAASRIAFPESSLNIARLAKESL